MKLLVPDLDAIYSYLHLDPLLVLSACLHINQPIKLLLPDLDSIQSYLHQDPWIVLYASLHIKQSIN
jgi:hypothetical protein